MKRRLFRLFAIITVLAILLFAVPSTAAFAAAAISVNPNPAKIGQSVTIAGSGYSTSSSDDLYYVDIYLTNQVAAVGTIIDTGITIYKLVINGEFLDATGAFDGPYTFPMPTALDEGVGTTSPVTITPGMTLYVCATIRNLATNVASPPKNIGAFTTMTVAQGASFTLTPATGAPGATVQVHGGNFPVSTALSFTLGGTAITPTSGDTQTDVFGTFTSTITIPAGTAAGTPAVVVTAGATTASATFTVTAPPVPAAINSIVPTSGPVGTAVTIIGSNFPINTAIVFTLDAAANVMTPVTGAATSAGGTIASVITIPASAAVGAHTIIATAGTATANVQFTVTGAATTTPPVTTTTTTTTTPPVSKAALNIVSNTHYVGATIGISGTGFTPGAIVAINYDTTPVATVNVDVNSTFIAPFFTAPASKVGNHTITASDGVNTAKITFAITASLPSVPLPLTPLNGATVKSPITFTWGTSTGNNAPIGYRLQIASDRTFPASSILIDHGNITTTTYILSDTDAAKLTSTALPYYWRIESVDAASTESGWTGAGAISVKGPFVMPKWGYWAGGAGLALVFFLIGLWVGRRTAFYY